MGKKLNEYEMFFVATNKISAGDQVIKKKKSESRDSELSGGGLTCLWLYWSWKCTLLPSLRPAH